MVCAFGRIRSPKIIPLHSYLKKGLLSQMKAIQITQTGGPEVMSIREVPTPVPGPGEVLIRVAASGVNFIDLYFREGLYSNSVPFIPGQPASGTTAPVAEG